MVEVTSQQGAFLAFLSLSTVGFICAICLRCKKKSSIIQENNQLYVTQMFQRGGSVFTVTQSKPVTRTNQMSSKPSHSAGDHACSNQSDAIITGNIYVIPGGQDPTACYLNVAKSHESLDTTYVHPIATPPYGNSFMDNNNSDADDYVNVFPTQNIKHDSDDSDYENAKFLEDNPDDDDEPDYVNTA